MQAVVDSLLTHYNKKGQGKKTVLLLHGWGDSSNTFKQLQDNLADNYSVIAVDLPGFGQSQIPNDVWSLDNYARFVRTFLKKLSEENLYAVIAHSNGGAVAIRALALEAIAPKKLILLASAGIRDRQKLRKLGLKIIAKTGKVATFWLPAHHKRKLQKKLYGAAGSDMLVVPHLQETFKITVRQDVQNDAKKINIPTLLIYGQNDKATPPEYGKIYQNLISGSQFEVVEDAGHFVHHDQAEQVAKLIGEFLR